MNFSRRLAVLFLLLASAASTGSRLVAGAWEDVLAAKVRAEASRLEAAPASDLFGTLMNEGGKVSLRLTKEQVESSRCLDELTRAILKAGLLRGLDRATPPTSAELAERLGEVGKRGRRTLVAHAEAIALEVILTPNQANRLRKATGRRPTPSLVGRDRVDRRPTSQVIQSVADLEHAVEEEQRILGAGGMCSSLFRDVVVYREAPGKESQGTFSAAQLELAKALELSAAQLELANRLNQLACDILLLWLSRSSVTDRARLADWEAADWYDAWDRRRNSLVAHAETLLLRGLLSPSQAEVLLVYHWRYMGPLALVDPELAGRLKLSRNQRDMIVEQLENRRSIRNEVGIPLLGLMEFRGKMDEFGRDVSAVAREEKRRVDLEADWLVWSVLTESQLKKLHQILGPGIHLPQPPAGQRRPVSAGRRRSTREG